MKWCEIFRSKYLWSFFICFEWWFCFDDINTIENPMNMCIDSEIGSFLCHREKYFCSFDSNSWKFYELFYGFWWKRAVFSYEYFTSFVDIFCFIIKKWDWVYKVSDLLHSHLYSVLRSFEVFEKITIDNIYLPICCLRGHQNSDKKLKLIIMIEFSFCIWKHFKYCFFEYFYFFLSCGHRFELLIFFSIVLINIP